MVSLSSLSPLDPTPPNFQLEITVAAAAPPIGIQELYVTRLVLDTHSLSYLYTIQSQSSPDRIYDFSVVTLLDDEQVDFYNSTDGVRTPKQDWLRKMKKSVWEAGTEKLKYDGQWLNRLLDIQMKVFRHRESDGHTLQWRVGCEVEEHSDGLVKTLNCINEFAYDGQDLISYNWTLNEWSASVSQARMMVKDWNDGHGYQTCEECEHGLRTYLQYKTPETHQIPPDVHVFVKKPETSNKLTLTCLATGFYPKDVVVRLRQFTTSLPEHLLTSSGVRPNEDGTYQLRKSMEIQEDKESTYNCYVGHSSLNESVNKKWDGNCGNCQRGLSGGAIVGVTVGVIVALLLFVVLVRSIVVTKHSVSMSVGEMKPGCTDSLQPMLVGCGGSGSPHGGMDEVEETSPLMVRRNSSCPNRTANDPSEEGNQTLPMCTT
ncbi:hypothetical protein NFI96_017991 [Prochilodus magdalenae]|nr:hypothetical protein NFI96_017991 [Prochilodus magdalenae]